MRNRFLWLFAGSALLSAVSCEKVIDLEVGDSTPQVVIEARITDDPGQVWSVQLTRSKSFTDNNTIVPIVGASVWITDAIDGVTDTLQEGGPGIYFSSFGNPKTGVPGHRYELTVITPSDGTFTAVSTMPQKVPLDSLYIEVASLFGQKGAQLFPVYTDPAGTENFYRFRVLIRGRVTRTEARDDRFSDGLVNGRPVGLGIDDSVKSGESVLLEMQCIDASAYKYFSTLGRSDGNSAAPANPISNISGGALGYFSAYTISRDTVALP